MTPWDLLIDRSPIVAIVVLGFVAVGGHVWSATCVILDRRKG